MGSLEVTGGGEATTHAEDAGSSVEIHSEHAGRWGVAVPSAGHARDGEEPGEHETERKKPFHV